MGELSNTTINGVSYDFKDAGAARQSHSHTKSQITDFPTSMPASDVSAWAKASSKPSYTASEVGAVPNTAAGVSAAINQLTTGDSAPTDNDYYVSQYAGGGTSTTTYHRRPVSKLWDYIKSKLSSKGSATQPVYFSNGVPVATTYTLGKSVPADAKFTDTTYSAATTSAAGLMSAADKSKLNGIATGAQVNSITGVKGNAESSYRTGNVNLTPANIGAAASSHTHNYAGSSSAGGAATSANKLNTNAGSATQPVYFSNGVPVSTTSPSGFTKFSTVTGSAVVGDNETGGFAVYGPIVFIDDTILVGSGASTLTLFNIYLQAGDTYPAGAPLPPIPTQVKATTGVSTLAHAIPVYYASDGKLYTDAYLYLQYSKTSTRETYRATIYFDTPPTSNVNILINFSYIGK